MYYIYICHSACRLQLLEHAIFILYIYIYKGAIDAKEFFEAVEFYARVRKRVRRPVMLDLACGHGLVRLLFASCEQYAV